MISNQFARNKILGILDEKESFSDLFILLGNLDKSMIASSIQIIESKLQALGYPKRMITKTKLIGVEVLDNILKHQSEASSQSPYFEVLISQSELRISSGNCVSKKDYLFLNTKLKSYVQLNNQAIKEKYMLQMKQGNFDSQGNAGLGLLTIIKRSVGNYKYGLTKKDEEHYFFNSSIKINFLN